MISSSANNGAPAVTLIFSGDLLDFFSDSGSSPYVYRYCLMRRASIKDII
jgi:hypothetical protein